MIQATFTVSGSEFNNELVEKIKMLLKEQGQNFEVFIRVKAKESPNEMKNRIEEAAAELERGENTVFFTPTEFETLSEKLAQQ
jgi:mannose/fructose-specific phosphotransferase system component IIA